MAESLIPAHPLENNKDILVDIYDDGAQTVSLGPGKKSLILLPDDSFGRSIDVSESKHPGIRPRWGMVLATTDYAEQCGIHVGDKVLLDTMKWSRGAVYSNDGRKLWRIKADDVLIVDDEGLTEEELDHIASRYNVSADA